MIRKFFAITATAMLLMAGSQMASAAAVAPETVTKAPATTSAADGSYKVARSHRRGRGRRRGRNRGRNLGIGLGLGALALGAGIAASRDRGAHRSCRRVERRCANRHGWETRRWYNCVEDRGC